MSQYIILNLAAPLHKPVGSSSKVSLSPVCFLLQQVAQPQNTRWNLFTCHCQSTSSVSQTDNHSESHVTTHLSLILNVYLEAQTWRNDCLFTKAAKRYCSRSRCYNCLLELIVRKTHKSVSFWRATMHLNATCHHSGKIIAP